MVVTIKDVARETGLSIATISKYMNGGNVRTQNKQLIDEAIRRMGYYPNKAARGLRNFKTYTVGVILDGLENQYFSLVTECLERELKKKGYSVLITCHRGKKDMEKKCIDFLIERQVDGVITVPTDEKMEYMDLMHIKGIPVIAIDRMPKKPCDCITSNAAAGAYQAVEHLLSQGHDQIAVITGTAFKNKNVIGTAVERMKGYLRVIEDYGLEIKQGYIQKGDFSFASGYESMQNIWHLKDRPTAVFITNYNMTLGAMTAIHNLKIKVPEEISVVAFDDLEFSLLSTPKLTAVKQPAELLAAKSVELLMKRIQGDYSDFPSNIKLPTKFHVRNSVKNIK